MEWSAAFTDSDWGYKLRKRRRALGVTDGHDPTRMLFEALDGRGPSAPNLPECV